MTQSRGFLKKILPAAVLLGLLLPGAARAAKLDSAQFGKQLDPGLRLPDKTSRDFQFARADHWRLVGRTLLVDGHVYIPYGNLIIKADRAMIDLESRDLEAYGNIEFLVVSTQETVVTLDALNRLMKEPDTAVEVLGVVTDPLGEQKLKVRIATPGSSLKADRVSGNFATGLMHFTNLQVQIKNMVGKAKRGTRQPGGEIKLEDMELSSCEYLAEDQSHFSISLATANLYPHETEGFGFGNMEEDQGEYSMWGYNGALRVYGVPVFYLPIFYKPKDESPGLFHFQVGKNSSWGYYLLGSKRFQLMDYPDVSTALDVDWYGLRGVGYGERTSINTETSRTEINAYGIYDIRPYESSSDRPWRENSRARLDIPHQRFDFQVTNMTHLTPHLDFRGQVEWMSDAFMLDDYFSDRASSLKEPATYAALEYQADRFSAALYARVKVNSFFNTLQKLPEFRLDMPRQEIIPGWNLYYQGSHTADYFNMNWAEFDRKLIDPQSKLDNYYSGRFDSVNFLYYPLRADFINIIPRAGLRLTGYTNSSDKDISEGDIYLMQLASNLEQDFGLPVNNYDTDGGGKFRVAAEFGAEANTKIYRSWQNVRNAFWGLDGLRHVCEPYINYTYIPKPTVDRENLLFFDDADRIQEQNFMRFGLRNRLQTRRGGFGESTVYEWISMENYWDIYFNNDDYFNHIGDFCTKLTFAPTRKLSFTTFFSIDAGHNQEHDATTLRASGYENDRPGLSGNVFNRLYFQMMYAPIDDLIFRLGYNYRDGYLGRAAYSMGSTLTELESGGIFDRFYAGRTQTINFGVTSPITPDRKTYGSYDIAYDVEEGGFKRQVFALTRLFHCVRVSAFVEIERTYDSEKGHGYEPGFGVTATLVGMESALDSVNRSGVSNFSGIK